MSLLRSRTKAENQKEQTMKKLIMSLFAKLENAKNVRAMKLEEKYFQGKLSKSKVRKLDKQFYDELALQEIADLNSNYNL